MKKLLALAFAVALTATLSFAADPAPAAKAAAAPAKAAVPAVPAVPAAPAAAKKAPLLDINTATVEQLMTIPGIGDAFAKKIVENRPYANKTQLVSKNVLPAATYEKVKELVIAKQPPKPAAPATPATPAVPAKPAK